MEISFASDGLAEAECEDDSKDLDAEDGDGHDDDDVQVRDDPVVHCFVAALQIILDILDDNENFLRKYPTHNVISSFINNATSFKDNF
jgi:hypothetical protein